MFSTSARPATRQTRRAKRQELKFAHTNRQVNAESEEEGVCADFATAFETNGNGCLTH